MKDKKKLWAAIGIVVLTFIILIGGTYLKHKQGEREMIAQAEKVAKDYIKKEKKVDIVVTNYEITPMGGIHLFGYVKGDKKRKFNIQVMKNGSRYEVGLYGIDN
ncbi:archaellum component FlaF (FlaF/FlaG flagellin family) [Scopulibacillus daqui]|uniref:Archaellum component FlaF (FlaF/FlaG flagellin family) n=1 Tax=Scopulibacillus daqui TaxID=1469162 RepID=A0ABS2PWM1_9BACL|nr:hypothetical protein [Scopulibacillus daqui]MBM7644442.1 archaellum component FlaF (FlaF/FlaG flagellin family) [Scopulibacillus daqui]